MAWWRLMRQLRRSPGPRVHPFEAAHCRGSTLHHSATGWMAVCKVYAVPAQRCRCTRVYFIFKLQKRVQTGDLQFDVGTGRPGPATAGDSRECKMEGCTTQEDGELPSRARWPKWVASDHLRWGAAAPFGLIGTGQPQHRRTIYCSLSARLVILPSTDGELRSFRHLARPTILGSAFASLRSARLSSRPRQ